VQLDKEEIRAAFADFYRLMGKVAKLEKQAHDFGTGDKLSPVEIHTLDEIGRGRAATATELCGRFGVTKGAVSQILAKLHRKGYVSRTRNEAYGKEILLSLTDRGKVAFVTHAAMHNAMDEDLLGNLAGLGEDQIRQFRAILDRIESHVEKYLELQGGE
jgi:DNA-binding MarR family transcriptional regulator